MCNDDLEGMCCCGALFSSVSKGEFTCDPVLKCFACYIKGEEYNETGEPAEQIIRYCPFCGEKLPNLYLTYLDVIEKELGKEAVPKDWWVPNNRKHLPLEFQTSEWWKKRWL